MNAVVDLHPKRDAQVEEIVARVWSLSPTQRRAVRARIAEEDPAEANERWPGWTSAVDLAVAVGVNEKTARRWARQIHEGRGPVQSRAGGAFTAVRRSESGRWFFRTDEVKAAERRARPCGM